MSSRFSDKPNISLEGYCHLVTKARQATAKGLSDPQTSDIIKRATEMKMELMRKNWLFPQGDPTFDAAAKTFMKMQYDEMQKTNPPGVGTWIGFNFYDLRGPAYFLFPLLTPFIQMIPRKGKVNAGMGTVAHWKATRNPNSTYIYVGVQEGQRNATATPNEIDYLATYKELGMEAGNSFTSQWAGEGYTDNLADEHFRNLARLRLQEEMMTLLGNSGTATGNLGFALGTPSNVTAALATSDTYNVPASAGFASGTNVSACVVAITGYGLNPGGQAGYGAPPTVANGLVPNTTRTNVDGTTLSVNGGTSAISNVSTQALTNATAKWVKFTVPAVSGAVGYAWYLFSGTGTSPAGNGQGNCTLAAITPAPFWVAGAAATGTQLGNAAGLSVDSSYQSTDFDGLLTYAFKNGYWNDMGYGSFTPLGNGQVKEIENDLQYLWNNFQAQPDAIWCSSDVRTSLDAAITYSSTGTNAYIFPYDKGGQEQGLLGGFIVSGYKSKYSINASGGSSIPIRIHPMMPTGTLYYDINTNPYPHSRIPAVREFLTQRDYYAIEWPVVTREWTYGTYVQEVLAHYMPWVSAIRTGIGPFVAPCWIAAAVFEEDFYTGYRTGLVRKYLVEVYEQTGLTAKLIMGLYRKYGKQIAELTKKNSTLKKVFTKVFSSVLKKAEQKYC